MVNQRLAVSLLESQGHRVTIATNGREAVEKTQSQPFDVVLMDIEMPEMDGLQATREIRLLEQSGSSHLPIVAVTSNDNADECLDAGMDAYLAKPLTSNRLSRTLRSLLAA